MSETPARQGLSFQQSAGLLVPGEGESAGPQVIGHAASQLQPHVSRLGPAELPTDDRAMLHRIAGIGSAVIAPHVHLLEAQAEPRPPDTRAATQRLTDIEHEAMGVRVEGGTAR